MVEIVCTLKSASLTEKNRHTSESENLAHATTEMILLQQMK